MTECLGRSRGGMSPKIHACIQSLGNAVRLVATAGQAADCLQALSLLNGLDTRMVIADTSYNSDANRTFCADRASPGSLPVTSTAWSRPRWTENITATVTKPSAFLAAGSSTDGWLPAVIKVSSPFSLFGISPPR